ncbi:MAG: DUF305 domain-containing protein [Chloroflexi bacterium]|nr:DUF305 domain-containing protein [Chloroflexota bacterium]
MTRFSNVLAVAFMGTALVACGGQATTPASQAVENATAAPMATSAATQTATQPVTTAEAMPRATDDGSMNMNAPFDAQFIDSMIMHHQGAIDMAKQAQAEAQRPEIKKMAEDIIKAQQSEIDQMKQWRAAWYPDLKDTGGLMMDMGTMMIEKDASIPFDIRFINAMIPHHEGAIAMAREVQQKAEHPEIKKLAEDIIKAQQSEIDQMKQWRAAWATK